MSYGENLRAMRRVAAGLLDDFLKAYDERLVWDGNTCHVPYGSLPATERLAVSRETPPSSRLSCDVALGYLAAHVEGLGTSGIAGERLRTAYGLLRHAFRRQHPDGYFVWNYGQSEIDQVDLGTVLDTYYYFRTLVADLPADIRAGIEDSARRAIRYLKTAEQPQHPGVIQKRAADPEHPEARRTANYQTIDVINGNALAATAACRAAVILGDESLAAWAAKFQRNVVESFGRHVPGWWVYIEKLDTREMVVAETILYQAMTALYMEPLYRARPTEALREVLAASLRTLAEVTDAEGELDWSHEARKDFVDSQLLMLPSAAAALADVCDITSAGRRRLELVRRRMYDGDAHLFRDAAGERGHGGHADELRQIWATSDLALIVLFARRAEDGVSQGRA